MDSFTGTERFHVVRRLGEGGMGVVYEALDTEQGVRVALKRLHGQDAVALLSLKNEFRALRDLQHHNLVSLGELVEAHGQWFFTMELVEGPPLLQYVRTTSGAPAADATTAEDDSEAPTSKVMVATGSSRSTGPHDPTRNFDTRKLSEISEEPSAPEPAAFHEDRVRAVLVQLAEGLSVLHEAGKVHRDIKPPNLLLAHDGRLVISDFGLVSTAVAAQGSVVPESVQGTPAYMAPELVSSPTIHASSDWFSVGVVLYRALTGHLPFSGPDILALELKRRGMVLKPSERIIGVPPDLDALCMDLLHPNPGARPGGGDVLRALGAVPERRRNAVRPAGPRAVFVGRSEERAQLVQWVTEALVPAMESAADVARSVVVQGESGVGKSALAAQLRADVVAAEPTCLWLSGRCHERESVPYKALDGIIDELSDVLAGWPAAERAAVWPADGETLCRLFPVLRRAQPEDDALRVDARAGRELDLRRRAFVALRSLLGAVARQRPVVLAIDDLQWADADSFALLDVLLQAQGALALVVTVRASPDEAWLPPTVLTPSGEAAATASGALGRVRHLLLRPLSDHDARALVRELTPAGASVDVEAIARGAAGHPLFIEELLLHARPRDPAVPQLVPLDDAMHVRVLMLPPDARELVALVALAGKPIQNETLRMASQLEAERFARARDLLEHERLVRATGRRRADAVEPYHDRIRETVVARLAVDVRRPLHRRLAEALGGASADAEQLATHWLGAGDASRAADLLARAAAEAEDVFAYERAIRLCKSAAALLHVDDGRQSALRERLASAIYKTGSVHESALVLLDAAKHVQGRDALALQREAAGRLLVTGHFAQGMGVMQEALRAFGLSLPSTKGRALLAMLWQRLQLRRRGLAVGCANAAASTPEVADLAPLLLAATRGLGLIDPLASAAFSARHLRHVLDVGTPDQIVAGLGTEIAIECGLSGGVTKNARAMLALAEEIAARELARGNQWPRARNAQTKGCVAFVCGLDHREALEQSLEFETFLSQPGNYVDAITGSEMFANAALWHLGEWRRLRERWRVQYARALERGDVQQATSLATGMLSSMFLVDGRVADARRAIDEQTRRWPATHFLTVHYHAFVAQTQLALYEGDVDEAARLLTVEWPRLLRSFLLRIPSIGSTGWSLRARVLLARAARRQGKERKHDVAMAHKALAKLRRSGASFSAHMADMLEAQADLLLAPSAAGAAPVAKLERAERGLREQGMKLAAAAARVLRGRATSDPALVEEGLAAFRAEGVVQPERALWLIVADTAPPAALPAAAVAALPPPAGR